MSEPGQGGFWQVDHTAPPPSRIRRRNFKPLASPQRTTISASPIDPVDPPVSSTLGSSASLFPSVLAEQLPGGRAHGMNEHCIVLPTIQRSNTEVFPSSPKRWKISTVSKFMKRSEMTRRRVFHHGNVHQLTTVPLQERVESKNSRS